MRSYVVERFITAGNIFRSAVLGVSAEDRAAAHVFADEILLRLADEAWAYEERGDHPERASICLGNAGSVGK